MTDASHDLRPVWFQNKGEIDPLTLTTMGASVKTSDSPIGYFGTGLKFSIATILRGGGKIDIFIGKKRYHVRTVSKKIRDVDFDLVYIDGEPAGYATNLGRDWLPWMAYRELHSNGLDEPEFRVDHGNPPEPKEGYTQIRVWDERIQKEFYDRHETFLSTKPIEATKRVEIHPGESKDIYYRGVKVATMDVPSLFTYNFLQAVELTEDRTAKSVSLLKDVAEDEICRSIKSIDIITAVVTASKNYWEYNFHFTEWMASGQFNEIMDGLMNDRSVDMKELGGSSKGFIEGRRKKMIEESHAIQPDRKMKAMLKAAKDTIADMGLPLEEYPIIVVENLGEGVMGQAKNGKAFIARPAFQNGQKYLVATLLEEWLHLTTGYADYSRPFQDWCINEMISLYERFTLESPEFEQIEETEVIKAIEIIEQPLRIEHDDMPF